MAVFCSKCGTQMTEGAQFCPNCGQPAGAAHTGAPVEPMAEVKMNENVAGLLCYVLGWVTGLIFLLTDKRPFVRFHAAQSIVVFGGLQILQLVLGFGGAGIFMVGGMMAMLRDAIGIVALVLWIVLMIKAYQGQRYRVPIAANIADNLAK